MLDLNQDGTLARAEFEQTLAFMAVVGNVDSLVETLDIDAIWNAATGSGELTKAKLGEGIRDMFGEGLKNILEQYQIPVDAATEAAMAAGATAEVNDTTATATNTDATNV